MENDNPVTPVFDRTPQTTPEAIETRFTYHSPNPVQAAVFPLIRENLANVANLIVDKTPSCREQSLALTALEEAMFWANAAVARNQDKYPA